MSRWKAAGIHLGVSLIVAALVGSVIYFVWYPPPYFSVSGGSTLMLLIMSVDVVIGPVLTLVIFKSGKKGLKFDLSVISALQFAAFCYGLTIIAIARPVYVVMALDRFIPVYANQLEDSDLAGAKPEFSKRPWTGPTLVGARLPTGTQERSDLLSAGLRGKDVEQFPKYYVSYPEIADEALAKAKALTTLSSRSAEDKNAIDTYVVQSKLELNELFYLPLVGRTRSYTMVISKTSKRPTGVLAIDPW
jgi:hypothetical protein